MNNRTVEIRKYPLKAIKDMGRLSPDGVLVYNLSEGRVELMKGQVEFESEENQGSTFTVEVPRN